MVNRENMDKLADALESGKYEQGRLVLRTYDDKYCCLGVACDISGLGSWHNIDKDAPAYVIYDEGEPHESIHIMPKPMTKWLGITEDGLFTKANGERTRLTHLNDSSVPFREIAEILRNESIEWAVPN